MIGAGPRRHQPQLLQILLLFGELILDRDELLARHGQLVSGVRRRLQLAHSARQPADLRFERVALPAQLFDLQLQIEILQLGQELALFNMIAGLDVQLFKPAGRLDIHAGGVVGLQLEQAPTHATETE